MRSPVLLAVACLVLAGCNESTSPSPGGQGTLIVATLTTGGDFDLDGYQLHIDDGHAIILESVDEQAYLLPAGVHGLEFEAVAPNCSLAGNARRLVAVAPGATVRVEFVVACRPTGIAVFLTESGVHLDASGSEVLVDGTSHGTVPAGGALVVSRLEPGEHALELRGVAPNCTLAGSPTRTATVANAELTRVDFRAACVATSQPLLRVTAPTTGPNPDGEYTVFLHDLSFYYGPQVTALGALAAGATLEHPFTSPTHLRIELRDVATNCSVGARNPSPEGLIEWGQVLEVAFPVTCGP